MIHFRFHVVSIIAVFLAIAIGTVMGATFVGRGVIDRLQSRIDTVEGNTRDARADNRALTAQADDLNQYIEESAPLAVAGTLTGVVVEVVAERGVDSGAVDRQAQLLRTAGATVPGVIWLEESWSLEASGSPNALRSATGLSNRSKASLRSAGAQLLGQRLAVEAPVDDVLSKLVTEKFVTLAGVAGSPAPAPGDFSGSGARALIIGGPGSALPDTVVSDVAAGLVGVGSRPVISEVFVETETIGDPNAWIDPIVDVDALRNQVSTVNNAERTDGQVAVTIALATIPSGQVGSYGEGRDRMMPDVPVPTTPSAR